MQQESRGKLIYQAFPEEGWDKGSILMSGLLGYRQIFLEANREWTNWQKAGLENISPHQVPEITKPEKLQRMTAPATYKILLPAINGRRSLRDLAIATDTEPSKLGKSLFPYVRQGMMAFKIVGDTEPAVRKNTRQWQVQNQYQKLPCIACIDDAYYIHKQMQQIVILFP